MMCVGIRALPSREVRYRAIGHAVASEPFPVGLWGSRASGHKAAPEPTSAGRRGPEPLDTW
jgi:hypothetical protein